MSVTEAGMISLTVPIHGHLVDSTWEMREGQGLDIGDHVVGVSPLVPACLGASTSAVAAERPYR